MCTLRTISAACLAVAMAQSAAPAKAKPIFTTVDVPGATETQAAGINISGAVAGDFEDSNATDHGFIRGPDGTFTKFDPPGSTATFVFAINAAGAAVGRYADSDTSHCFIRSPTGVFTSFDLPQGGQVCYALSINTEGEVSGYEYESRHDTYGFLRAAGGKIKTIKHTDSYTVPAAVNDAGTAAGTTANDGAPQGFVRDKHGTLTLFDAPGDVNGTTASGLNAMGWITGYYVDGSTAAHSYVRSATGAITTFDPPGATASQSVAINSKGQITGFYYNGDAYAGFVRSAVGKFKTFAAPGGAISTFPLGINTKGAVTGYYVDADYQLHGFLWAP